MKYALTIVVTLKTIIHRVECHYKYLISLTEA